MENVYILRTDGFIDQLTDLSMGFGVSGFIDFATSQQFSQQPWCYHFIHTTYCTVTVGYALLCATYLLIMCYMPDAMYVIWTTEMTRFPAPNSSPCALPCPPLSSLSPSPKYRYLTYIVGTD